MSKGHDTHRAGRPPWCIADSVGSRQSALVPGPQHQRYCAFQADRKGHRLANADAERRTGGDRGRSQSHGDMVY